MRFKLLTFPLMLLLCVGVLCGARPHDPWVFRCVLDKRPRMVVIALHQSLWVAYDATTCSLYKAWRGDVDLQGAVYTTEHGPQPVVRGDTIIDGVASSNWIVTRGGKTFDCTATWKGYRLKGDQQVTLLYDLRLANGTAIAIEEQVDAEPIDSDHMRLVRTIRTTGVPEGLAVSLVVPRVSADRAVVPMQIDSVELKPAAAEQPTRSLALKSNGSTVVAALLTLPANGKRQKEEGH